MTAWPSKPIIYQINTWVWLNTLSRKYQQPITLHNVPEEVLNELTAYGFDAVWLMGVWTRSPKGAQQAQKYAHEYRGALPDLTPEDIVGSAYAIYDYQVEQRLGGRDGLAALRRRLQDRGIRLLLDYVPNHVALDHRWVTNNPGFLMQGTRKDLKRRPSDFYEAFDEWERQLVIAHGRDPYFPGWSDTAQVNAFDPAYRKVALETLLDIATQCDGVRCDMAMLMVNHIFARTWHGYFIEEDMPEKEFWDTIIPCVKAAHPDFLFIAEVYWNMEFELQRLGFDYTYDKTLYDRLVGGSPREVRVHLIADIEYQKRLVRFIENHDEQRAYATLGAQKGRPAATLICTLPGATLLHDGQFVGRRAKLPVQINRQPDEPQDETLHAFYRLLLKELRHPIYQRGQWRLFDLLPAWSSNPTYDNLVAYGWNTDHEFRLVVVNLTGVRSQAVVNLSAWHGLAKQQWTLYDTLNGHTYARSGDEMIQPGLYVDLGAYESHIFRIERA